jgi:hypothetical protein
MLLNAPLSTKLTLQKIFKNTCQISEAVIGFLKLLDVTVRLVDGTVDRMKSAIGQLEMFSNNTGLWWWRG